jgi:hypothetical protein
MAIYYDDDGFVRFEGTAAQLISDGLVPESFVWPQKLADAHWSGNGLNFCVRRVRPRGHKGTYRTWADLDSWAVSVTVAGRRGEWYVQRRFKRMAHELEEQIFEHSREGHHQWKVKWDSWSKARDDKAFKAFKALVPGLTKPKRKARTSSPEGH